MSARPSPMRRYWAALLPLAGVVLALLWAALAPLGGHARELAFEIPPGAWARRMAGDPVEPLPGAVLLTLGVKDVLLLRNRDSAPHSFGPVMIMPGRELRTPFYEVSEQDIAFTARVSGRMRIVVEPHPTPGLDRLRYRLRALAHAVRYYRVVKPS